MNVGQMVFDVLGFVALASALTVALGKNLVRSLFMFFVTLFALAGLYVFALADFVAVTQIVIYVGGVLVLMLFAFMLSNKETLNNLDRLDNGILSIGKLPAILVSGLLMVVLVNAIIKTRPDELTWLTEAVKNEQTFKPSDNNINSIGINFMTLYLLPFEALSILLMMTLIGAAHLARKEEHHLG